MYWQCILNKNIKKSVFCSTNISRYFCFSEKKAYSIVGSTVDFYFRGV